MIQLECGELIDKENFFFGDGATNIIENVGFSAFQKD
jgi:hypothetical protein